MALTQNIEHNGKTPKVSIGLPVFNGERYLAGQIRSLLSQTFQDLEVVIVDNSSTDATPAICQSFVEQDSRVRYFRNDTNIGLSRNYQRAFHLARGEYFKWAAHDDLHAPEFISKCVEILDGDSSVVVCYTLAKMIDEFSNPIRIRAYGLDTSLSRPDDRFRKILWIDLGSPPIFGLIRRSVLQRTNLLGFSYASDQVLLAELALYGRFHEIPEGLLLHREHPYRSVFVHRTRHALMAWLDPTVSRTFIFPSWRLLKDYLIAILRAPLSFRQRLNCLWEMLRWVRYRWKNLLEDLKIVVKEMGVRSAHLLRPTRS
jgi:glycosyltransferase involved in cell wall biosynthesis